MKLRILVALIAIPLLLLLIFLAPLWAFALAAGLAAALAALEFLRCAMPELPRRFSVYASVSAFAIPLLSAFWTGSMFSNSAVFLFAFIILTELVLSFQREDPLGLEPITAVLFAGGIMPLFLASLVRIGLRDENSAVYLLIPFVAAFSSDSGAYFAGSFLGKRKLFPNLSPNKTMEGCIGGFLAAMLLMLLYGLILRWSGFEVNLVRFGLYGFFGSLACQIGDLAFSAVKRLRGIKDYGSLIPGHGGALDRFDGMVLAAPMIEALVLLAPAVLAAPAVL